MSILKEPYEISIWENVVKTVEGEGSSKEYWDEVRALTIGGDTFDFPGRAINPIFKQNMNGTSTLTFSLYKKYFDEIEGDFVDNYIIPYIYNESKIKLKYRDKWYCYVVKEIDEDKTDGIMCFNYTCEDSFITELAKTGYEISFKEDLSNQTGELETFVDFILDGSDWVQDTNFPGTTLDLVQTTKEYLFEVQIVGANITLSTNILQQAGTSVTLKDGDIVYLFFTEKDKDPQNSTNPVQIYVNKINEVVTSFQDIEGQLIHDRTGNKIFNYLIPKNKLDITTISMSEQNYADMKLTQYYADRIVISDKTEYNKELERVVTLHTDHDQENRTIYSYTDYNLTNDKYVKNLIDNGKNFNGSLAGWIPKREVATKLKLQQAYKTSGMYQCQMANSGGLNVWPISGDGKYITLKDEDIFYIFISDCDTFTKHCGDTNYNIQVFVKNKRALSGTSYYRALECNHTFSNASNLSVTNSVNTIQVKRSNVLLFTINKSIVKQADRYTPNHYFRTNEKYLTFDKNAADGRILNTGLISNNIIPKIGDKFLFRIKALSFDDYILNGMDSAIKIPHLLNRINLKIYNASLSAGTNTGNDDDGISVPTTENYYKRDPSTLCEFSNKVIENNTYYLITIDKEYTEPPFFEISGLKEDNNWDTTLQIEEVEFFRYIPQKKDSYSDLLTDEDNSFFSLTLQNGIVISKDAMINASAAADNTKLGNVRVVNNSSSNFYNIPALRVASDRYIDVNGIGGVYNDQINKSSIMYYPNEGFAGYYAGKGYRVVSARYQTGQNQFIDKYFFPFLVPGGIRTLIMEEKVSYFIKNGSTIVYINKPNSFTTKTTTNKVKTLVEEKSNRFNLLQSCAELFECWVNFYIKYDVNGNLDRDENYDPIKQVYFDSKVGQEIYYGFSYGINLKDINRKVLSDKITTKMYVTELENSNLGKGTCTIAGSNQNESLEHFLLNFQYFVQKDLIDEFQLCQDLYLVNDSSLSAIGYIYNLRRINKDIIAIQEGIEGIALDLEILKKEKIKFEAGVEQYRKEQNKNLIKINSESTTPAIKTSLEELNEEIGYKIAENLYSIAVLTTRIADYEKRITSTNEEIEDKQEEKETLHRLFNNKYAKFIREGVYSGDNFINDDLYYMMSKSVLETSSMPEIQYSFAVIDISPLTDYEEYVFNVGDISYVEDTEFFGYDSANRPYKEEVVISEIEFNLDDPTQTNITVQNFKTQFEDLFQRISATVQSLEFNDNLYKRAELFTPNGILASGTLENSLLEQTNQQILANAVNQIVNTNNLGITITDLDNASSQLRIVSGGIFISDDAGKSWTVGISPKGINADYLVSGQIDTGKIRIFNGIYPAFAWDTEGISAYLLDDDLSIPSLLYNHFVRLDQHGLYIIDFTNEKISGTQRRWYLNASNSMEGNLIQIQNNSVISLTTKGLRFNKRTMAGNTATYTKTVELDTETGDAYFSGEIIASSGIIGNWEIQPKEYYNSDLVLQSSNHRVGLNGNPGGGYDVAIWAGRYDSQNINPWEDNGNWSNNVKFYVTHDGMLVAKDATINGTINSINGWIGGWALGNNLLSSGSNDTYVGLNSNATSKDTIAIWCGNNTATSAPFRVTRGGKLYATGAEISGDITISSVAGWTVGGNNTYLSSGVPNNWALIGSYINPSSYAFEVVSGSSTMFYVNYAGKLFAKNAEIEGHITATSGSFSGNITASGGSIGGLVIEPGAGIRTGNTYFYSGGGYGGYNINTNSIKATGGRIGGWTINSNSISTIEGTSTVTLADSGRLTLENSASLHFKMTLDTDKFQLEYLHYVDSIRNIVTIVPAYLSVRRQDDYGHINTNIVLTNSTRYGSTAPTIRFVNGNQTRDLYLDASGNLQII